MTTKQNLQSARCSLNQHCCPALASFLLVKQVPQPRNFRPLLAVPAIGPKGATQHRGATKHGEVGQPFVLLGLVGVASAQGPLSRETLLFLVALHSAVVTSDTSFATCGLLAAFPACVGLGSSLITTRNARTEKES